MSQSKPRFSLKTLLELRKDVIKRAYAMPRGHKRDHLRKFGLMVRSLCRNSTWLNKNVIDGPLLPDRLPMPPKAPE
jgi:hypothetical protein